MIIFYCAIFALLNNFASCLPNQSRVSTTFPSNLRYESGQATVDPNILREQVFMPLTSLITNNDTYTRLRFFATNLFPNLLSQPSGQLGQPKEYSGYPSSFNVMMPFGPTYSPLFTTPFYPNIVTNSYPKQILKSEQKVFLTNSNIEVVPTTQYSATILTTKYPTTKLTTKYTAPTTQYTPPQVTTQNTISIKNSASVYATNMTASAVKT